MKRSLVALMLVGVPMAIGEPLPPIVPILTPADLRSALADVTVSRIELLVPQKKDAAERLLSERFFNQPVERRFSGLLSSDWEKKWQLFSDALVAKAKAGTFDGTSLQACLQRLNHGRNRQTMLRPFRQDLTLPPDATREERSALEKKQKQAEADYQVALKERERNPEKWYDHSLAVVPVGAFLGQHSGGECWIVVCKWEYLSKDSTPTAMGHVKIWAMDTKTHDVVAYVTCD